jgi:DNA-binding IclR family transcriptional regulator
MPSQSDRKKGRGSPNGIQSVEIGTRVLQAVAAGDGPMSLSAIGAAVGMQPSHVYRYVVSLMRGGLLAQVSPSGQYDLGPACARLGVEAMRRVDEVGVATRYLLELRDRTRHSVCLAAWSSGGPTIIRWVDGAYLIPVRIRAGTTLPLLGSAVGHAFLAYLRREVTDPVVQREIESGLSEAAPPAAVERIIADVRSTGVANTRGILVHGSAALAAPIFDVDGQPVLVMGLIAQNVDLPASAVASVEADLLFATRAASAQLGFAPIEAPLERGPDSGELRLTSTC